MFYIDVNYLLITIYYKYAWKLFLGSSSNQLKNTVTNINKAFDKNSKIMKPQNNKVSY